MSDRYAAFLSYAHRYRPWVQVLQRNLELCLAAAGRPGEVFLDDVDLASGRSWVGQLQAGLDRSEQLVLVATPEALASPRVGDEWQSFLATRRDWQAGHLHIVELVPTPIPPFLESIQRVDFREPGEERYRSGLQDLVAGLLGQTDRRNLPALADGIEVPAPPDPGLPYAQREKLVSWLAPLLSKKVLRLAIAPRLRLQPEALEGQPSWACAASAALVWTTGSEEPVTAAIRIVETLKETFEEDEPGRIPELVSLRDELVNLQREGPERGLLAIWLRQVASDHERLVPYFQRQAEFDLLERVYVQLEMRTETPRKATADLGKGPLDRPAGLREVLSLPRGENPWITGRWVVLGEPGAGKTTLLRHLTATLARDERRPWVPLLESLPRLMRERESLLDRVARRLERSGQPGQGLASALDRAGREGRLLLLFDGLDEVPREDREDAEQLLRDLAVHWPDTPLVVTSRPIGYSRPGSDFRELTLLPLDRARRREFLARWLGRQTGTLDEARADAALGALDAAELRDLAGNPLYLTLMALLFEQGTEPDRNRTRLYDQVFRLLLEGGHRSEGKPLEAREAVHGILRQLAHGMTEENRDAEPVSSIEDRLYRPELDSLRDKIERVSRWRNSLRSFLEDVAERTGILGPHDGPDSDWRFWHRTFREALAAERLEEEYASQPGKVALLERATTIAVEQDLSRWAEPFALLAGRVADPDALVRELVRVNRPLGLRALATAQRLRDETLREVLALSGDWQERREVFLRLPELVAEPRRALALLDLLRQRTRNGNDLYFLDKAIDIVSHRSPEHAGEAAELRSRLYQHISRPDEELFRWIETPKDGRVQLWREIPAGEGWVEGSTELEPVRTELLLIKMTRPFSFATVPVTNAQYAVFDPERAPGFDEACHPIVRVTWFEAVSFCRWLSTVFPWASGARLPTGVEWEYACRAGTRTRFWSGDDEKALAGVGWYEDNSQKRIHRVGEKPANPWGLYDVHGNVWEWTLSPTGDPQVHAGTPAHDPTNVGLGEATDSYWIRGGSFSAIPKVCRSGFGHHWLALSEDKDQGFRVVLPPSP